MEQLGDLITFFNLEEEDDKLSVKLNFRRAPILQPHPEKPRMRDGLGFEYAEHAFLGDTIQLQWNDGQRYLAASRPFTLPNGLEVTYGQINGLGGDFYGTFYPISDGSNDQDKHNRFLKAWDTLATETTRQPDEAQTILNLLKAEVDAVNHALAHHVDPSDAYEKLPDVTWKLQMLTMLRPKDIPSYLRLAQMNWDHFGEDAHKTYVAGHSAAIELAVTGDLQMAYAMNAFADHFLEDSFAAGHVRTPRRYLHGYLGLYDLCAKYMHDEENAIGLQVENRRGDSWRIYGDKRQLDTADTRNKDICQEAVQASADEIYTAWRNKKAIDPDQYAFWALVPKLDQARDDRKQELAALFRFDETRRSNILNRRDRDWTRNWTVLGTLAAIKKSVSWDYPIYLPIRPGYYTIQRDDNLYLSVDPAGRIIVDGNLFIWAISYDGDGQDVIIAVGDGPYRDLYLSGAGENYELVNNRPGAGEHWRNAVDDRSTEVINVSTGKPLKFSDDNDKWQFHPQRNA